MAYQLHELQEPPARQGVCVCITGQEWRKARDGDVFGNCKIQLVSDLPKVVITRDWLLLLAEFITTATRTATINNIVLKKLKS